MSIIGPGRVFWARYPGNRGGGKLRPMIVASPERDILRNKAVIVVVCSTDFGSSLEPFEILLPFHSEGNCRTKLKRATVAVCDWTTEIPIDDIHEFGGCVNATLLLQICALAGLELPP